MFSSFSSVQALALSAPSRRGVRSRRTFLLAGLAALAGCGGGDASQATASEADAPCSLMEAAPRLDAGLNNEPLTLLAERPKLLGQLGQALKVVDYQFKGTSHGFFVMLDSPRVYVADEVYWNPLSAVGEELSQLAQAVRTQLKAQAGCVVTPYALTEFGGQASMAQLLDAVSRVDFVAIDPYHFGTVSTEQLLDFARDFKQRMDALGKPLTLIAQGFAVPGTEAQVQALNSAYAALPFTEFLVGDAIDFYDIPDEWQINADVIPIQGRTAKAPVTAAAPPVTSAASQNCRL